MTPDVWLSLVAGPPERLGVVLADLPEEGRKREWSDADQPVKWTTVGRRYCARRSLSG